MKGLLKYASKHDLTETYEIWIGNFHLAAEAIFSYYTTVLLMILRLF